MTKRKTISKEQKNSQKGIAEYEKLLVKWHADARVFKLTPPLEGHSRIVVVSASTPDCYEMIIWGLNEDDSAVYRSIFPSYRTQDKDHRGALARAGYKQVGDVKRFPRPKR